MTTLKKRAGSMSKIVLYFFGCVTLVLLFKFPIFPPYMWLFLLTYISQFFSPSARFFIYRFGEFGCSSSLSSSSSRRCLDYLQPTHRVESNVYCN